jgi:hypothetical protein
VLKHIRLIVMTFVAALALSAMAAASASAAVEPDLLQAGGVLIPAGTPVTAKGEKPVLKSKGLEIKCETVTTVEKGGTEEHGNIGEVIGETEKSISIKLLFTGCETSEKAKCTTKGQTAGHILTLLLLATLTSKKNAKGELIGGSFTRNAEDKEGENKTLAEFTCGEKAVTVTGCVPATTKIEGAKETENPQKGTMQEGTAEASAEVEEPSGHKFVCEEKALGIKSEQVGTEKFSFNKEKSLLSLELKI